MTSDQSRAPTWLARFLHVEAAGGILLLAATALALLWANSPWQASYERLWQHEVVVGGKVIGDDLRHWVNDGLMALFFLVVGLEIKRELVVGQLASRRDAALPVAAAVGGMVVPAALYLALNAGGPGAGGWGIPMATDIAFAVGVLALVGDRAPASLKVFLLALAIVDDIGAITVIAVFYSDGISPAWLGLAAAGLAGVAMLRRAGIRTLAVYAVLGVVVWFATYRSGVHATIAGVALGLLAPVPASERLEAALHPWTSYVVVPLFALANAGIPLSVSALDAAAGSRITAGVVVGLVVGKPLGILGAALLAVRIGLAARPAGVRTRQLVGAAVLAGIGFTVSIFVTGLAFEAPALQDQAKIGVLVASLVAATVGLVVLRVGGRQDASDDAVDTMNSARSE